MLVATTRRLCAPRLAKGWPDLHIYGDRVLRGLNSRGDLWKVLEGVKQRMRRIHEVCNHIRHSCESGRTRVGAGRLYVKNYLSYVIFDSTTGDVLFRRVEFDFAGYKSALRAKSIPIPPWMEEMGKERVA